MSSYLIGSGNGKLRGAAVLITGAFLVSSAAAGCSSDPAEAGTEEDFSSCDTANMDPSLPTSTARDWVTYADHLAIVHWVSEKELETIPDDGDPEQGEIQRSVTIGVDDVLWSRPQAPALPDEITYFAWGWTYDGDERTELGPWGFPRIEEGHTYVMPIVRYTDPDGAHSRWGPFASDGTLPYDDGVLGEGETTNCAHPQWAPVAQKVIGQDAQALADVLDSTKPDPKALPYMNLDPEKRMQHVMQDN